MVAVDEERDLPYPAMPRRVTVERGEPHESLSMSETAAVQTSFMGWGKVRGPKLVSSRAVLQRWSLLSSTAPGRDSLP
ncbi:uncharacterized protein N7498_001601 [Penicillium cinerascens]|uniref:Uncharacterized protein n=1 Tax=Penicillium cinerascens TaxID=70096 RepID=A0A9W9TAF8_9EURO|nr:uncharacterized protein N7498_001601 [Penicillium cinerascens]KAJ5215194.1 hypothetical protein N7498_001601 [Penicillium cinerascens]